MKDTRKYTFEIADFENTPDDAEIARFMEDRKDYILSYTQLHPEVIMTPPKADFVRIVYGFGSGAPDEEQRSFANADKLRRFAAENGAGPAIESCRNDAQNGCRVVNDAENRYTVTRSDDDTWAFRVPVGSVGNVTRTQDGHEVLILLEIHPPDALDVLNPADMTTIATNILRQSEPSKHLLAILKPALESVSPDFRAITEGAGGQFRSFTGVTHQSLTGSDIYREAPAVIEAFSDVKPGDEGLFSNPMVQNNRVYIFRITELHVPAESDFEAQSAHWKAQKAVDPGIGLVAGWIRENMPSMTSLNLEPVQARYGVLQPNGNIKQP